MQHLALITSYRNDTANEDILPVVQQYTLKDLGLSVQVVMAPTPIRLSPVVCYGSRTRHTPLWHITFTSLLTTRDVFDTHLFIHVRLFHPQTNRLLRIFLRATSSFSRRADRYNTNPHTYKSTCLTLHSSTADDTKPLETPKTLQTTFDKQTHWHAVFLLS